MIDSRLDNHPTSKPSGGVISTVRATETAAVSPSRIAVLHIGPDPESVGGMAAVIGILVDERLGCDAAIALATWRPDGTAASLWRALAAARRIVSSPRRTVLHAHLSERGSFVREGALLGLARRLGHPTVATIHGAVYGSFAQSRPGLARVVLSRADAVIALSDETAHAVATLSPGSRVFTAPNPTGSRPATPIEATDKLVLFGGEICLRKGVDLLVAAWPQVHAAHRDARCLIVGPPGDYTVPATAGIEVLAPVSAARMRDLIDRCRVVVLPSRAEAMPMILTEAIGAGRPFVASRVGGVSGLAVADEQLVSADDVPGLAAAVTRMLSRPAEAREIGQAGRALWERTRSPRALTAVYRQVYECAVAAADARTGR